MSKLKKNIIYNFIYQFFVLCFPLIVAPYLSRVLGAKGIGIYSFYYSIAYYFVSFALLGLSNYGTKTISSVKDKGKKALSIEFFEIYTVQFYCALLVLIVYSIYFILFNNDIYSFIFVMYVLSSFFDISWFYFGIEEFKFVLTRNIIIKTITTILIFSLLHSKSDTIIYCIIMSCSLLLSQVLLWIKLKKYISYIKVDKKLSFKKHFYNNFKFFIPVLAVSIYKYMDKIMLGCLASVLELGYYENVEKIVNIPVAFVTALGTVMLSRISNLYSKGDNNTAKKYLKQSILFTSFLSFAMIFGLLGISNELIPIYFGKDFMKCIELSYFMIPTVIFLGLSNVIRTQYLIPYNKEKIFIVSVCLGAVVNFILNIILIPFFQSNGAAFATLVAEFVVFIYQYILVRKELKIEKELINSILFAAIGFLMYLILRIIRFDNDVFTLVFKIMTGAIVYLLLSLLYYLLFLRNEKYNKENEVV